MSTTFALHKEVLEYILSLDVHGIKIARMTPHPKYLDCVELQLEADHLPEGDVGLSIKAPAKLTLLGIFSNEDEEPKPPKHLV